MEHAVCEDLLEAVLVLTEERGAPPTTGVLAARLGRDEASVGSQIRDQERSGRLASGPSGEVLLLPEGRAIAARVANRHRILQSFLAERLGMEPGTASGEACLLEHQVSDETIRRLSEFLAGQDQARHRSRHRGGRGEAGEGSEGRHAPRSLAEYAEGTTLRVMAIGNFSRVRRLADVGLLPGETLVLKRRLSNGSVVVGVKGSDIALSAEVAAGILVEETG